MVLTDPIADMLTRIRNANSVKHESVDIPASKMKNEVARILKEEGYIRDYKVIDDNKQGILRIYLKYGPNDERVITGIKRISKPGLRMLKGRGTTCARRFRNCNSFYFARNYDGQSSP